MKEMAVKAQKIERASLQRHQTDISRAKLLRSQRDPWSEMAKPLHCQSCPTTLASLSAKLPSAPPLAARPAGLRLQRGLAQPVGAVQAKLVVGPADDEYEREADRVAEQAISMPDTLVQPREDEEEEKKLQTSPMIQATGSKGGPASPDLEQSLKQAQGGGSPLAEGFRSRMESAFGADFSSVRIHADKPADRLSRSIQARAFTRGHDIFLRQGEYQPQSAGGQRLLAHELTHVVQQSGRSVPLDQTHRALGPRTSTRPMKPDPLINPMKASTLDDTLSSSALQCKPMQIPSTSEYVDSKFPKLRLKRLAYGEYEALDSKIKLYYDDETDRYYLDEEYKSLFDPSQYKGDFATTVEADVNEATRLKAVAKLAYDELKPLEGGEYTSIQLARVAYKLNEVAKSQFLQSPILGKFQSLDTLKERWDFLINKADRYVETMAVLIDTIEVETATLSGQAIYQLERSTKVKERSGKGKLYLGAIRDLNEAIENAGAKGDTKKMRMLAAADPWSWGVNEAWLEGGVVLKSEFKIKTPMTGALLQAAQSGVSGVMFMKVAFDEYSDKGDNPFWHAAKGRPTYYTKEVAYLLDHGYRLSVENNKQVLRLEAK